MREPHLSVLIPVHDEARTLSVVLERVAAIPVDKELIVVDDGSTDATPAILARWVADQRLAVVITQPHRGKGAAVRAAIRRAAGEICVIQDADLEYDPRDVPRLIEPIQRGRADVVFGSRLAPGAPERTFTSFGHLAGNRALSCLARVLYGTPLTDIETGYKAFRTEVLRALPLREDRFGIEPEITAQVCKRRLRIAEVPISYHGREHEDGKEIGWRDGLDAVRVLLACRVR
jgi:glycosyltransferase involved in cell wall biosynthesis